MKIYRYRKDLWSNDVYLLHHIRKGFRKLYESGRLNILYSGECTDELKFPKWIKTGAERYEFYAVSWRPENISIITNGDFKKVCEYIRKPKQLVLDTLFNFSILAVNGAELKDKEPVYKADFSYSDKICYAILTRLIFK